MFSQFLDASQLVLFKKCEDLSPASTASIVSSMLSLVESVKKFVVDLASPRVSLPSKSLTRFSERSYEMVASIVDRKIACEYRNLRETTIEALAGFCTAERSGGEGVSNDEFVTEVCEKVRRGGKVLTLARA